MKSVYLVLADSQLGYAQYCVMGVFSTHEKASEYIEKNISNWFRNYRIKEMGIDVHQKIKV